MVLIKQYKGHLGVKPMCPFFGLQAFIDKNNKISYHKMMGYYFFE